MARASHVYTVCSKDRQPLATFTVKHECKRWIINYEHPDGLLNNRPFWVAVFPDGRFASTIPVYTLQEFLESRP